MDGSDRLRATLLHQMSWLFQSVQMQRRYMQGLEQSLISVAALVDECYNACCRERLRWWSCLNAVVTRVGLSIDQG